MERPLCSCHGEAMYRNGTDYSRTPPLKRWVCASWRRNRSKVDYWEKNGKEQRMMRYQERKDRGVCTRCSAPSLSSTLCWDCLSYMEERHTLRAGLR